MEKRGEGKTGEQAQTTARADESLKGETGEREIKRVEREKKEVVVATWNVRTLAVKGKNGLGHAETLLLRAQKSHCDIIGLQQVRRGGQGSFEAAGYIVYFSGSERVGTTGSDWLWQSLSWRQAGSVPKNPSMNVCAKCS